MADGQAAVLAIDGGNSKTDVALIGWDGTVLAALRGPGASHEAHGVDGAVRRLGELILAVAGQAGIDGSGVIASHLSACLAGADLPEEEATLTAALLAHPLIGQYDLAEKMADRLIAENARFRPWA